MAEQVAYNMDCMEYMKTLPDRAFDLAVVDPPYGDGVAASADEKKKFYSRTRFGKGGPFEKYRYAKYEERRDVVCKVPEASEQNSVVAKEATEYTENVRGGGKSYSLNWDIAPDKKYFDELFRVSKNQIIWGGNYFELPPTRCFLILRKLQIPLEKFSMAPVEYAWTSFSANAKMFECFTNGNQKYERFHPTQKPVQLYEWIYRNYAKPGMRILDTHLGSGSSRIAARELDLDFVGCELDADYFAMQEERWKNFCAQGTLF